MMSPRSFPVPRPPSASIYRPKFALPKIDDRKKAPDAVYLLDAGVGFAFAHARLFRELVKHYEGQLRVTTTVVAEWRFRANSKNFESANAGDRDAEQRARLLQHAGAFMINEGISELEVMNIPEDLSVAISQLQQDIAKMRPAELHHGQQNAGECATILIGRQLRMDGVDAVILCSDDDKARRLGATNGLNHRATPHILKEMAISGEMTAQAAYDHFQVCQQISQTKDYLLKQFNDAEAFS